MSSGHGKLSGQWIAHLAPFREPWRYQRGLTPEDEQTLRDIGLHVRGLLGQFRHLLPAGLAAMLDDYLPELRDMTGGRWEGIGDPASTSTWPGTSPVTSRRGSGSPATACTRAGRPAWYLCAERCEVARRALQLLAA